MSFSKEVKEELSKLSNLANKKRYYMNFGVTLKAIISQKEKI